MAPEDLGGKKYALLTCSALETDVKIPDASRPGGYRVCAVMSFEEYSGEDDRALYLNRTMAETVVEKLGDSPNEIVGQSIPVAVVKVNNPKTGKMVTKVAIASSDEWDRIVESAKPRRTAAKRRR